MQAEVAALRTAGDAAAAELAEARERLGTAEAALAQRDAEVGLA